MRSEIRSLITRAVDVLLQERSIDSGEMPLWALERTKQKGHGDFAINVALVLAKPLGNKPRDLAQAVLERLPASVWITRAEIAGPGFINFYLSTAAYYQVIDDVRKAQKDYGCCRIGKGRLMTRKPCFEPGQGPLIIRDRSVLTERDSVWLRPGVAG